MAPDRPNIEWSGSAPHTRPSTSSGSGADLAAFDPHTFEEFIASAIPDGDGWDTKEWVADALDTTSALGDVWHDLDAAYPEITAGTYSFRLGADQFKSLVEIVSSTPPLTSRAGTPVKFFATRSHLRARTFEGGAFMSYQIPLKEASPSIGPRETLCFVLNLSDLEITLKAVDTEIDFTLHADAKRLDVVSGCFSRPLLTVPLAKFRDIVLVRPSSPQPPEGRLISIAPLREALKYVASFVSDDAVQEDFSLVQWSDGMCLGGTPECVAAYAAEPLQGLSLKIRSRFTGALATALANLPNESTLIETIDHYVLHGAPLTFGFEKTRRSFPSIGSMFSPDGPAARIVLTRSRLVTILRGLAQAVPDDDLVEVKESRDRKRLRFTAATAERNIRAWCPASRQDLGDSMLFGFVPRTALLRAAEAFDTPNMVIDLYPGSVLIVRDGTDTIRAEAVMRFLTQKKARNG